MIAVVIIVLLLYRLFKPILKPIIKGFLGEKTINLLLKPLPNDKYIVLNDIFLEINGVTTQIDHIVLSIFGIYVIETKNYTGWILGNENDEYWVQSIYGKRNRFKNPIRQNYGHIEMLKNLLSDYKHIPIHSMIAFSSDSELKVKCEKTPVVHFLQVRKLINKMECEPIVTFDEIVAISNIVKAANITDKAKRKQHASSIQKKVDDVRDKEQNGICPKCGAALVERKGKYGKFIGCSNYPKCKHIVKK